MGLVTRVLSYRVVALPFLALAILAYASLFNVREWPWPVRAALLVVWMVATLQVLRLAFLRDRRIDRATEQYERQRSRALRVAREHVIKALLSDRTGGVLPPEGHGTVFLMEGDVLRPFWPPSQSDSEHEVRSFQVGHGAVGLAVQQNATVVRTGLEVSDATFGLTPEQQERFRRSRAVAAVPIRTPADEVIGALGVITRRDAPEFDSDGFVDRLNAVADTIAVVLLELVPPSERP